MHGNKWKEVISAYNVAVSCSFNVICVIFSHFMSHFKKYARLKKIDDKFKWTLDKLRNFS